MDKFTKRADRPDAADEYYLREALFSINRALYLSHFVPNDSDVLVSARDIIWNQGVKLFGWSD